MSIKVLLLNVGRVIGAKGGAEKVFCDMANALSERGMDVYAVCCEEKEGLPGYPLSEAVHFVNAGLRHASWRLSDSWIRLRAVLATSRASRRTVRARLTCQKQAQQLKETLEGLAPDVIVAFQPEPAYIIRELLGLDVPLIASFHGAARAFLDAPEFPLYEKALEASDVLTVLMPEYAEMVRARLPQSHVECIPNAIPVAARTSDLTSPVVMTVGRADAVKRHRLLIEAFELLLERFPDWNLEIWGETHSRYGKQMLEEVARRNLQKRVLHRGVTNDVPAQLLRASVFTLPSANEGFSLALGEAMSAGLPAVGCADCPSVNTIIRSGENGILTEPTPRGLAEGLAQLMGDVELRRKLGAQAKEDMRSYAPPAVWKRWAQLIRSHAGESCKS